MPNQKQFLSFFYNDCRIRVVVNSNNELLFCLADICNALNWYRNGVKTVADKIKAEFQISALHTHRFHTSSGMRHSTMITKTWLDFILVCIRESSKAQDFMKWLDTEVFSNVRQLEQDSQPQEQQPKSYGELLLEAGRLALENERLLAQIKEKENQLETKTILKREFLGSEISQKSENGYFSATDLFKVANQIRVSQDLKFKILDEYNALKSTKEFEAQLAKKYTAREFKYGRGEHLWVHPFLFADMALWLFNPDFKLEVYEWIFNDLPKYIDDSCKGE